MGQDQLKWKGFLIANRCSSRYCFSTPLHGAGEKGQVGLYFYPGRQSLRSSALGLQSVAHSGPETGSA